jgi:hypothetical protein
MSELLKDWLRSMPVDEEECRGTSGNNRARISVRENKRAKKADLCEQSNKFQSS